MARREWNVAGNGQFGRPAKSAGFRRNPQQHAGTGAIRQEKTPTENGWGFVIGGLGATESLRQALVFKRIFVCANELVPPSVPPNFFATPKNQVNVRLYFA
jgi:hypothetical protein